MNQAEVSKLVSKLRVPVPPKHRNLRSPKGPEGRIDKLRKTVTGLIKFERIELNHNRADEARQYAERLISEAIRYGDCHKPTMDTADFWLLEKELIHKLFKVLVPRYENTNVSYTRLYQAPKPQFGRQLEKVVLELRGNPYPDLLNRNTNNKLLIQNVLLDAAKNDYRQSKINEIAKNVGKTQNTPKAKSNTIEPKVESPKNS
uniref:Large ribosomal subunit protein bL17m n=1 Tax=Heliothis virescens TaxID=7102 RepID=A0A2A4J6K7_HELVI